MVSIVTSVTILMNIYTFGIGQAGPFCVTWFSYIIKLSYIWEAKWHLGKDDVTKYSQVMVVFSMQVKKWWQEGQLGSLSMKTAFMIGILNNGVDVLKIFWWHFKQ